MDTVTTNEVSIRYSLRLEDGTKVSGNEGGDVFNYIPGQEQILPVLEEAMLGMPRGAKRRIVLAPEQSPGLKLDVARLAFTVGHPHETLILEVEIL